MIPQSEYIREEHVILALQNHLGNQQLAAADLGISRGELVSYMARHPDVLEAAKQIKEGLKDRAESILINRMETSDALLMFYLRTQAKDRGYDSSVSVTGANGTPLEVTVNARTLIAAMRNGFDPSEQDEGAESSNLLPESVDNAIDFGG